MSNDLGIDKLVLVPDAGDNAPSEVSSILGAVYNSSRLEWANNNPMDIENHDNKISAARMAWGAVKQAGWVKSEANGWENERDLVQDGKFEDCPLAYAESFILKDREVFAVGKHNGIEYTDTDLEDMVKAFQETKDAIRPRVKMGHDVSKWKDGLPALGWATDLKKVGSKLVATFAQVPKILKDSIDSGRYKRVSSEVYHNLKLEINGKKKTFRRALAAVAFLGTDLPAVKNLADLDAYLCQDPSDTGTFDKVMTYTMDNDDFNDNNTFDDLEGTQMSDDTKKFEDQIAKLKKENDGLVAEKDARVKADFEADLSEYCETKVEEGKMTPASRDAIAKDMSLHTYTQDSGFSISFDTFKAFVDASATLDTNETGVDDEHAGSKQEFKDVNDELHKKTVEYAAEHKVNYADAQLKVIHEDEDLAKRIENDAKEY